MSNFITKTKFLIIPVLAFVILFAVNAKADSFCEFKDSLVSMTVGDKLKLGITGNRDGVSFISKDKSIVKISKVTDSKVVLKAKKAGKTKIVAKLGKKTHKCAVVVNETLRVSDSDIVISKPTQVTVRFTGVSSVKNYKPKYVTVSYADRWQGDDMVVTLTPIAIGSEKIVFFNGENDETVTVKVKVTGTVEQEKTIEVKQIETSVDDGAEAFIAGENKLKISFALADDSDSATVNVRTLKSGTIVYSETFNNLKKDTVYNSYWDGLLDEKVAEQGAYYCEVTGKGLYRKTETGVVLLAKSPFTKGDGTENNPYLISTVEDLSLISFYPRAYFKQDKDIDIEYDNRILNKSLFEKEAFEGSYDGNGHKISQFIFSNHTMFGVIGQEGTVKNIVVSDGYVMSASAFFADENNGRIENCTFNNCKIKSDQDVSFIAGYNGGTIADCTINGEVLLEKTIGKTTLAEEKTLVGGLVLDNAGRITNCKSLLGIKTIVSLSEINLSTSYVVCGGAIASQNEKSGVIAGCEYSDNIQIKYHLPKGYTASDLTCIDADPVVADDGTLITVEKLSIISDDVCGTNLGAEGFSVIDCTKIPFKSESSTSTDSNNAKGV